MKKNTVTFCVALLMLAAVVFSVGWTMGERYAKPLLNDTIVINTVDTLHIPSPPDTVTNTVVKYVPVPNYIHDTDTITDTILVQLPFEQHHAKLEDVADVWYSGYQAKIDSSVVYRYQTTKIVETYIQAPAAKNMVGVSAGLHDASLSYMRRIGPMWIGASAGYTYQGTATARGTIAFQF